MFWLFFSLVLSSEPFAILPGPLLSYSYAHLDAWLYFPLVLFLHRSSSACYSSLSLKLSQFVNSAIKLFWGRNTFPICFYDLCVAEVEADLKKNA